MSAELFGLEHDNQRWHEPICEGAVILRRWALDCESTLADAIDTVAAQSPFRHLVTPGGHQMSVATTSCGRHGWMSDRRGYRYQEIDPLSGNPWPEMPSVMQELAEEAAKEAGFPDFSPDACLINRYAPGAKLSLHQDRDERDYSQPIVSVSLGLPATFQFGGFTRNARKLNLSLVHGDIVVWGGPSRLRFHGVLPLRAGHHDFAGAYRINLTFRRAG